MSKGPRSVFLSDFWVGEYAHLVHSLSRTRRIAREGAVQGLVEVPRGHSGFQA